MTTGGGGEVPACAGTTGRYFHKNDGRRGNAGRAQPPAMGLRGDSSNGTMSSRVRVLLFHSS